MKKNSKCISMKDFIDENLSDESKKNLETKTIEMLEEFDAKKVIVDNINNLEELSDYCMEALDDVEFGNFESIELDLKVIISVLEKLRG